MTDKSGKAKVISELIRNSSIELSDKLEDIVDGKGLLPYGMRVYIPSLPGQSFSSTLDKLRVLNEMGFDPVPHIAARRVGSREDLLEFLNKAVNECGVHHLLLVGGDLGHAIGPYQDAIDILRDGVLTDSGITEISLAGYPEGHPRISMDALDHSLNEKLELAANCNMDTSIITQFTFAPARIVDYCSRLARSIPQVPVYIGMVGPTDPLKLLKYAKICGVNASMRALNAMGFKAAKLVTHTDPNEQIEVLGRYVATRDMPNVHGVHIFSFGGFKKSASWMSEHLNL